MVHLRYLLIAALATSSAAGPGQQAPEQVPAPTPTPAYREARPQPAPTTRAGELAAIAAKLGDRLQARIIVDPAVTVLAPPKAPGADADADAALSALAAQVRNGVWRRVYLPNVAGTDVSAEKVVAAARALEALEHSGVVLENPRSRRLTSYLKNVPIPDNLEETLEQQRFNIRPIYLITATGVTESRPTVARAAEMQRQMTQIMLQMSPQEVSQVVAGSMQGLMNMDPQTRLQMASAWLTGIRLALRGMSPQQQHQLMMEIQQFAPQMVGPGGMMRHGVPAGPMVPRGTP